MHVTFTPGSEVAELIQPPPVPAYNFIPQWLKDIPTHEPDYDGNKTSRIAEKGTSSTVRGCNPMLDSFLSGYIFTLPADVEFRWDNGEFYPHWLVDYEFIHVQAPYQAIGVPKINNDVRYVYKFISGWRMNTPEGYSTLFTHPLNRSDLPFVTFTGIVETDKYNVSTDFPFQVIPPSDGSSLIIEKGTPICQAIPFKRDEWTSEVAKYSREDDYKSRFNLRSKIDKSYRNQFWERKRYN